MIILSYANMTLLLLFPVKNENEKIKSDPQDKYFELSLNAVSCSKIQLVVAEDTKKKIYLF